MSQTTLNSVGPWAAPQVVLAPSGQTAPPARVAPPVLLAEPIDCVQQRMEATLDSLEHLLAETLDERRLPLSVVRAVNGGCAELESWIDSVVAELPRAEIVLAVEHVPSSQRDTLRRLEERPNIRVVWAAGDELRMDPLVRGARAARGDVVLFVCDPTIRATEWNAVAAPILKGCCVAMLGVRTVDRPAATGFWRRFKLRHAAQAPPACFAIRRELAASIDHSHRNSTALGRRVRSIGGAVYEMPVGLYPAGR